MKGFLRHTSERMFLWLSLSKEANPPLGGLAHSHGSGYPLKSCSSAELFSVLPDNANIGIYKLTQFKLQSQSEGIIAGNILHIDTSQNGCVIWFTKAGCKNLLFIEDLGIPNGSAFVPPLLWIADKNKLYIYALKGNKKPNENTALYHSPFFNVYANGNVCMGTVDVNIKKSASLEEFTTAWEAYFFNSYFSHLMQNHNPIKGNCVSLWKKLVGTGEPFPKEVLKKNNQIVKNLLK